MDAELRLKKAHITLMRHAETCLYSGVMLLGESSIADEGCPTAYTDGFNKRYGREFMGSLKDEEVRALILHENLHVLLKHIPRHKDLMKENARLANVAMDFVVNDIIENLQDKSLAKLPEGGLYSPKYHNWSVREVYNDLKQQMDKEKKKGNEKGNGGGGGVSGFQPLDEHDDSDMQEASAEEIKEIGDKITEAIQQGSMLAGKFGVKIPRVISETMQPRVDWRETLREFVTSVARGRDDYSWRRMNARRMVDDIYMPSVQSETIDEITIAIDTSGSIGQRQINEFAAEIVSICEMVTPDRVRVLWWDTKVHGEQMFYENYDNLASMLKPQGGGGTKVSCVSEYIDSEGLNPDCVVVFTDGCVERDVKWDIKSPTLWVVTERHSGFTPPSGHMVDFE
jgi:predicted metal-dependent peptidase